MGKAISVTINGERFPKKEALQERIRTLIGKYPVGAFLTEEDNVFCLSLFGHHPEARSKLGAGVRRIEVRLDRYGNKHFQIHRIDGTSDDISWVHCVTNARGDK
jgi:hypothetical protein